VSVEEKRVFITTLKEKYGSCEHLPKRIPPLSEPSSKNFHDFVTQSTRQFFTILELPQDFLEYDPSEWGHQNTFQRSLEIVQSSTVVIDLAERGGALIK